MALNYKELIDELIDGGYLKTPSIIDAFAKVDRKNFIPDDFKEQAYINAPLPIGRGQTISQPLTVAFMIELLEPKMGEKILEIGFGSGWQTVILAEIVGEKGKIFAIERLQELFDYGKNNILKYKFLDKGVVNIYCQDGFLGLKKEAPFDKIIVAASIDSRGEKSIDALPVAWKNQLKNGGIIVAPIDDSIFRFIRINDEEFKIEEHRGFAFVPFIRN